MPKASPFASWSLSSTSMVNAGPCGKKVARSVLARGGIGTAYGPRLSRKLARALRCVTTFTCSEPDKRDMALPDMIVAPSGPWLPVPPSQ